MAEFDGGEGPERYDAEKEGVGGRRNLILGNGGDDTLLGGAKTDTLDGGEGDDRLVGRSGRDFLEGRAGNDRLDGGDGADQIIAFEGDDTAIGGAGDDTIQFGGGFQKIDAGDGDDFVRWTSFEANFAFTVSGGSGDDTMSMTSGGDRFDGGDGVDTADYFDGTTSFKVDLVLGVGKFGAAGDRLIGVENVVGGLLQDTIIGNDSGNVLTGESGNDKLSGGLGADLLNGGFGADTVDGGAGEAGARDTLSGGNVGQDTFEIDTLDFASADAGVTADLVTGVAKGGANARIENFEVVRGSQFDDVLRGSTAGDHEGGDTISGFAGDDRLVGRDGDDVLRGGDGKDRLEGGLGRDTLAGNAGRDVFVYGAVAESPGDSGTDLIVELNQDDHDRIDLRDVDADATTEGRQSFHFVGSGAFDGAGSLRFEKAGRGAVLYGDTDGNADTVEFSIEIQKTGHLSGSDFLLA